MINRHGFVYRRLQHNPTITVANNSHLEAVGEILLKATTPEGTSITLDAIVVAQLSNDALISWHDLQDLEIIPRSFPAAAPATRQPPPLLAAHAVQQLLPPDPSDTVDKLMNDFSDVFNDELTAEPMAGPKMHIHLNPGARPVRVSTARPIPLRFQEEADKVIQDLLDKKVIARVTEPTEWCSPAFFVAKADNKRVRLVTDFTALNRHVRRPVHPFPSSKDIMRAVPHTAKSFAKLDCVHGYFQLALDEESSYLTTFILPSGRYRYLRAPMGLSASSDEWCLRSDLALSGIQDMRKIVDDVLAWAVDNINLLRRLRVILQRCRENHITISKKKFAIGNKITFAGYLVTSEGIRPDPDQTAALAQFPVPQSIKDLRAFLGLANQLSSFIPDAAQMSSAMRSLLKKDSAWIWLPEHQSEFDRMRKLLSSELLVKPFDPNLDTFLVTDASRLYGLGYGLFQKNPASQRDQLVQCGSCSLTDTQRRYATIELEMLAIVWAIRKLDFYLRGLPTFEVWSDHRPLEGVFTKEIFSIDNPRLQRMREKLTPYTFSVQWVPGKNNIFADVLSRFPVFGPEADDASDDAPVLSFKINTLTIREIFAHAAVDAEYQRAIDALRFSAFKEETGKQDHVSCPVPEYRTVWNRLSILDSAPDGSLIILDADRIVVPAALRLQVLQALHASHSGLSKTQTLARQLYYWPNMSNDVKNIVSNCDACRTRLPAQAPLPLQVTVADAPMSHMGTDLFEIRGQHWLLLVDRFSGYLWAHRLTSTTAQAIINQLRAWFLEFGFPKYLRSDGGPQYRTLFQDFCKESNITHELTSPYHSQANGLAEAAVKSAKYLLAKCMDTGDDFRTALTAWRNTPRADGYSPTQLFYGRRQRTPFLPTLDTHHNMVDLDAGAAARLQRLAINVQQHDAHAHPLPQLAPGDSVHVLNPFTHRWTTLATVVSMRPDGASYVINVDGREFIRNRTFLRPAPPPLPAALAQQQAAHQAAPASPIRASNPDSFMRTEAPALLRPVGPVPTLQDAPAAPPTALPVAPAATPAQVTQPVSTPFLPRRSTRLAEKAEKSRHLPAAAHAPAQVTQPVSTPFLPRRSTRLAEKATQQATPSVPRDTH